jgi:signal transduction histidine kinase
MEVQSKLGEGTTVTIRLPVSDSPQEDNPT